MGRIAVALVLVGALAAGCGGAGKPHFQAAHGWQAIAEPGQIAAAANVPFAAADRSESAPIHTVASLPPSGIVIWAQWLRRGKFPAKDERYYPRRSLPLRVQDLTDLSPEGFTCPRLPRGCFTLGVQAGSPRWDVAVWVFFGTDYPMPMWIADADAELARLSLPGAAPPPAPAKPSCPRATGTGWYDGSVRPASGPAGTTVVVSGRVPQGKQPSNEVVAYWNLDFAHWPTIGTPFPKAAVAGSPVRFVGTQNVAGRCSYRVRVTIPAVAPGRYPLEVLYGNAQGAASFAPVEFRVTGDVTGNLRRVSGPRSHSALRRPRSRP